MIIVVVIIIVIKHLEDRPGNHVNPAAHLPFLSLMLGEPVPEKQLVLHLHLVVIGGIAAGELTPTSPQCYEDLSITR